MQLRDVLTVSFSDLPGNLMTGVGEIVHRDGIEVTSAGSYAAGKPVFASVDADAISTGLALSGTGVHLISVLDGGRLVGLIDVSQLRELCQSWKRRSR